MHKKLIPWGYKALLATLTLFSFAVNAATEAGATKGSFQVDASGNANYTIPIVVPPGINGVQPSLALNYSSADSNNNLLGVGWSLSGLSAITRCARTLPIDGIQGSINFDSNDRFCVDGQRLIVVEGKYGQHGSMYRTEIDGFTRFYSFGDDDGPRSFKAILKDGSELTYGDTDDSRISVFGKRSSTRVWAISKTIDRSGNYITAEYEQNFTTGEFVPKLISYTGNNIAGVAPNRVVAFEYEDRIDSITSYSSSGKYFIPRRMSRISTYVALNGTAIGAQVISPVNLVKQYRLHYKQSDELFKSYISKIEECSATGSCLGATSFSQERVVASPWSDGGQLGLQASNVTRPRFAADFNADGLSDFAEVRQDGTGGKNRLHVFINQGNGDWLPQDSPLLLLSGGDFNSRPRYVIDVDGDTYPDFAELYHDGPNNTFQLKFYRNLGDGNWETNWSILPVKNFGDFLNTRYFSDFNGDGFIDHAEVETGFAANTNVLHVDLNQGNGDWKKMTFPLRTANGVSKAPIPDANIPIEQLPFTDKKRYAADFNGDGVADFAELFIDKRHSQLKVHLRNEDGWINNWSTLDLSKPGEVINQFIVDLNGDRLVDYAEIVRRDKSNRLRLFINKGDGSWSNEWGVFFLDNDSQKNSDKSSSTYMVDFNNDGYPDLAEIIGTSSASEQTKLHITLNRGDGTIIQNWREINLDAPGQTRPRYINDFNGDGYPDISEIAWNGPGNGPQLHLYFNNDKQSSRVNQITTGVGENISIEYLPLTNRNVYRKGSRSNDGIHFTPSQYVVASHKVWDEELVDLSFRYIYENARFDRERGFLGFASIYELDGNRLQWTNYLQSFPLVGKISQQGLFHWKNGAYERLKTEWRIYETKSLDENVYTVQNTFNQIEQLNNGSHVRYTATRYQFDDDLKNLLAIEQFNDMSTSDDDVVTCFDYFKKDDPIVRDEWWKAFSVKSMKVVKSVGACNNMSAWNSFSDLSFSQYEYDERMNLVSSSLWDDSQFGQFVTTKLGYDAFGQITSETDPLGNRVEYQFDTTYHSYIEQTISPAPEAGVAPLIVGARYEPKFGIKVEETDANGNTIFKIPTDSIDGFGRVLEELSIVEGSQELTPTVRRKYNNLSPGYQVTTSRRFHWDHHHPLSWEIQVEEFDVLGRLYRTMNRGESSKFTLQEIIYNQEGLRESESLPYFEGETPEFIDFTYDEQHRVIKIQEPSGASKEFIYHTGGSQISPRHSIKSPAPSASQNSSQMVERQAQINTLRQITKSTAADGSVISYEYDRLGRRTKIIDPEGEITSLEYSSLGLLLVEDKPSQGLKTYKYDAAGRLRSRTDGMQQTIKFDRDTLGRITQKSVINRQNRFESSVDYKYDTGSNGKGRLSTIHSSGLSHSFDYHSTGTLARKSVTLHSSNDRHYVTEYSYDPQGQVTQATYPNGSKVHYQYHFNGLIGVIELEKLNGQKEIIAEYEDYDVYGQPKSISFGNGVSSQRDYDSIGRITNSHITNGSDTLRDLDYTWNRANKLLSISDRAGFGLSQNFSYDNLGRLIGEGDLFDSSDYSYDSASNLTRRFDTTFSYDDPNKKHQITRGCVDGSSCSDDQAINIKHDDAGNMIEKSYRNDLNERITVKYIYNSENRLVGVSKSNAVTNDVVQNSFRYDHSGRRISKTENDGTTTFYISQSYEVVEKNGLLSHTQYVQGFSGAVAAITSEGDGSTPLFALHGGGGSGGGGSLVNSFESTASNLASNFSTHATSWSSFSSLLSKVIDGLTLVLASIITLCVSYLLFSALARGFREITHTQMGRSSVYSVLTMMVLNTALVPVANADLIGSGTPQVNQTLYFHGDHLGSTTLVTNESGDVAHRIAYQPYGEIDQEKSIGENNFRPKFTGKELDTDIDLIYFGARYYDPQLGRFLTPDPAEQYFSPYVYGGSDPLSHIDPDGEFAFTLAAIALGAVVGAYAGGAIANKNADPTSWDWENTWGYVVGGAAIGAVAGALAAAAIGGAAAGGSAAAAGSGMGLKGASTVAATAVGYKALGTLVLGGAAIAASGAFTSSPSGGAGDPGIPRLPFGPQGTQSNPLLIRPTGGQGSFNGGSPTLECASFVAGTDIHTVDGEKTIEDIEVGDEVWSYNEGSKSKERNKVARLFSRTTQGLIVVTILSESEKQPIITTPEHPFYIDGKGWIEADELQVGDRIYSMTGEVLEISELEKQPKTESKVFNFEVENNHNYYVGSKGALVHNADCPNPSKFEQFKQRVRDLKGQLTRSSINRLPTGARGPAQSVSNIVRHSNHLNPRTNRTVDAIGRFSSLAGNLGAPGVGEVGSAVTKVAKVGVVVRNVADPEIRNQASPFIGSDIVRSDD